MFYTKRNRLFRQGSSIILASICFKPSSHIIGQTFQLAFQHIASATQFANIVSLVRRFGTIYDEVVHTQHPCRRKHFAQVIYRQFGLPKGQFFALGNGGCVYHLLRNSLLLHPALNGQEAVKTVFVARKINNIRRRQSQFGSLHVMSLIQERERESHLFVSHHLSHPLV